MNIRLRMGSGFHIICTGNPVFPVLPIQDLHKVITHSPLLGEKLCFLFFCSTKTPDTLRDKLYFHIMAKHSVAHSARLLEVN